MADNHLTLYFLPSPLGMDWSSPASLAWSALKNRLTFKPHFIGHVFVEFERGGAREVAGMTGRNCNYLWQLIGHGRGLGILFHSFEGRLEKTAELAPELSALQQAGEVNFVRFLLNDAQCARVSEYLDEYRGRNLGRHYGLSNRPRHGEGSGCSAFAASFADVAGVLDQELTDAWSHSVSIPMRFAGPPLGDRRVGLLRLMWNARRWAAEDESHRKLVFWDPDRMFNWTNARLQGAGGAGAEFTIGKARGIVLDKTHLPAPCDPIWLGGAAADAEPAAALPEPAVLPVCPAA